MFLRNWARLYSKQTTAEARAESLICLLGKRYRAEHPFFGLRRIVDFALLDDRIIIEIDGSSHNLPVQRRKDLTSTLEFEKQGWRVVRFSNSEILDVVTGPGDFMRLIEERLTHRPTPEELGKALQDLDREFPPPAAKPRKRRRGPDRGRVKRKALNPE